MQTYGSGGRAEGQHSVMRPVTVVARVDEHGRARPLSLVFEGREYRIDRVVSVGAVAGSHTLVAYEVLIGRHATKVYRCRDGVWQVEDRRAPEAC